MSVNPIALDASGDVEISHAGHQATVPAAECILRNDGGPATAIEIHCPVCGAVSVHPVGGGAAPEMVQRLFVHLYVRDQRHPAQNAAEAQEMVRRLVYELEGESRYKLHDPIKDEEIKGEPLHVPRKLKPAWWRRLLGR